MQEFIEGTAVNVGVRLGCKGILIRSGMHSHTKGKNEDEKTIFLQPDRCHITVTTERPRRGTVHIYFEHNSFEVRGECVENRGVKLLCRVELRKSDERLLIRLIIGHA